ncbi:Hexose transporter-like protein [Hapsidospora chrysogenum ATCC 11550]|uniref:Hexose transporter-like protein n=1 Tax=Hapsidospora chrysogenum (strain ATCC 11550 / CBS 779.69 / DSM 880 / IAM 14645 / JCM 23072 / IMI 49137) TaxID=857340 RepID=A0A086TB58_HAPC1|nr:Hexose transporter-like protein [Hapsidospora chrysogenum ATCC 11550]
MVNVGTTADPIVTRLVQEDKVAWYKKRNLRLMYIWLFTCCMCVEATSGFDSQLINTLQLAPTFHKYLGNGRMSEGKYAIEPGLLGFVNSSYQLGSIFGVPVAPWFAQRYGRRWSIMAGSLIMVCGAIIQGFAQHVAMYIIARMILGFGILFCIISGAALIGELGHPKERAILTSLFNSSYFIGQITAAAVALGTTDIPSDWAWRVPSLLQICPSLLQIGTVFLLPESPRYLISHDRHEEALAILIKYHGEDDASSPLVHAEMVQIRETIKTESEVSKQSWLAVLATPGMRRRFLITIFIGLFTQLSGNTLLSYYSGVLFGMMGYTDTWTTTRINLANACWGLLNGTIIALVVTRFKRRHMYMLSAILMMCSFIAMTVSLQRIQLAESNGVRNVSAGISALFWYFAFNPCYNIGNNALTYTYLVELWPYSHRSRGIGVQQIFGKLAGFFSTNVNSIALDAIEWKYLAIYCGWIFFEFCIIFLLYPETSGRTLEELAFLFEDETLNERLTTAVEKQMHNEVGIDAAKNDLPSQPPQEAKTIV